VVSREELRLTRRRLLVWAGGAGFAALLPGCGEEGSGAAAPAAATGGSSTAPACVLTPELTEGPFYLDLDLVRRDITEGRAGKPLRLGVTIVDAEGCAPIPNAAVDVWHCDAGGAYSGVEGDDETFLRGIQITDGGGRVEFETIYPGWYSGRAVHIHLKVHIGDHDAHTGQLFFDERVTQAVYEAEPYRERGAPDRGNNADAIFGESAGSTIVRVSEGSPLRGEVTLGVRRA
jgi:hypothetical protein